MRSLRSAKPQPVFYRKERRDGDVGAAGGSQILVFESGMLVQTAKVFRLPMSLCEEMNSRSVPSGRLTGTLRRHPAKAKRTREEPRVSAGRALANRNDRLT